MVIQPRFAILRDGSLMIAGAERTSPVVGLAGVKDLDEENNNHGGQ
jgi:hypothetical protein